MPWGGDVVPLKCPSSLSLQQRGPPVGHCGAILKASAIFEISASGPAISQPSPWVSHWPSQDLLRHLYRGL